MARRSPFLRLVLVLAILAIAGLAGIVGAHAGDAGPVIPKATGGTCVAPPEEMRRTHMSLLRHGRDLTVREGERVDGKGLAACVSCHAVSDGKGGAVTVSSPQHFCRACHDYAAVKLDCFECHASRPEPSNKASDAMPDGHPTAAVAALADYAREIAR